MLKSVVKVLDAKPVGPELSSGLCCRHFYQRGLLDGSIEVAVVKSGESYREGIPLKWKMSGCRKGSLAFVSEIFIPQV